MVSRRFFPIIRYDSLWDNEKKFAAGNLVPILRYNLRCASETQVHCKRLMHEFWAILPEGCVVHSSRCSNTESPQHGCIIPILLKVFRTTRSWTNIFHYHVYCSEWKMKYSTKKDEALYCPHLSSVVFCNLFNLSTNDFLIMFNNTNNLRTCSLLNSDNNKM